MQVMQYFLTGLLLVVVFMDNARALPAEPVCSKFDYEMKTLEAMLRIENRAEKMMEEFRSVRDSMTKELDEIKNLKAEVERQQTAMESKVTALKSEAERQQTAMESKFTFLKSEAERQQTARQTVMERKFTALKSAAERQQTAMESKFTVLKSEAERQQTAMQTAMESKFTALKSAAERQQTAMESKFTALKFEFEEVPEKMTEEMQSLRDSMTKGLDEAERQRTETESKITALKSEVAKKLVPDEVIAFSVTNTAEQLVNEVPTFKNVITNIGNGYDLDTGIFTCPVDGLYMFVFTVSSDGKHSVSCYIKHNGTIKVYGQSYSDNSYTTAAASVNLLLQKGDLVTLGNCGGWNNVRKTRSTSFSGALIIRTGQKI